MSISNVFEVAALPPQPHSRSIFRRMPTPTNMQQSVSSLSRARSYDNLDFDIVPVELPPRCFARAPDGSGRDLERISGFLERSVTQHTRAEFAARATIAKDRPWRAQPARGEPGLSVQA